MTAEKTLNDLKAGDDVILREGNVYATKRVVKVKRTTDKQIIIPTRYNDGESRFRKDNGAEIGGSDYNPRRLLVATDEAIAEVVYEEKYRSLHDYKFRIPKTEKQLIEEVYDFLKSKNLL